jgi:gas vesicle protein
MEQPSTTSTAAMLQQNLQQVADTMSRLAADSVTVKQGAAASHAREQALHRQVSEHKRQLEAAQQAAKHDLQTLKNELTRGVQVR